MGDILMPNKKGKKEIISIDELRYIEYYDMQDQLDSLYSRSLSNEKFTSIWELVVKRENILLAYRNLKHNIGSKTAGSDGLTIREIAKLSAEDVVDKVHKILNMTSGYCPKPIRRIEIPKPDGRTRPIGIPCIWDRLIQQCILQILDPICEAKFSENSYGFRPNRSAENAIAKVYKHLQCSNLKYVIEFDIKSFFDNVWHEKLIRRMWSLGIRDEKLISIIKRILRCPIKDRNGKISIPKSGLPQGGILSPLLSNIVLDELDKWIEKQWENHPIAEKYAYIHKDHGGRDKSNGYKIMRRTKLKEMYIVRYADDFRIMCKHLEQAKRIKIAITEWLKDRLRLETSEEKTRIVDTTHKYMKFLGFKIRLHKKGKSYAVRSRIDDNQVKRIYSKLKAQIKKIASPRDKSQAAMELSIYNSMVIGIHNYYRIATDVIVDMANLSYLLIATFKNRLGKRYAKIKDRDKNKLLTLYERETYGESEQLRFDTSCMKPIYPIGYIQTKHPMNKSRLVNKYTKEGRRLIHQNLRIDTAILKQLMRLKIDRRTIEYTDNRISLYSEQWGRCAITGKKFRKPEEIHCHHIIPKRNGGTDAYNNLILVTQEVHRLIHAKCPYTIEKYVRRLHLSEDQVHQINVLRVKANLERI